MQISGYQRDSLVRQNQLSMGQDRSFTVRELLGEGLDWKKHF